VREAAQRQVGAPQDHDPSRPEPRSHNVTHDGDIDELRRLANAGSVTAREVLEELTED
jgi:hypothetical protein